MHAKSVNIKNEKAAVNKVKKSWKVDASVDFNQPPTANTIVVTTLNP